MGDEALCRAWIVGVQVKSKTMLETDELIFRGEGRRYAHGGKAGYSERAALSRSSHYADKEDRTWNER